MSKRSRTRLARMMVILTSGLFSAGSLAMLRPIVALADACSAYQYAEYHYSGQWTASASTFYDYQTGYLFKNAYYGWVGVDGEIDVPNHVPNLGSDGTCAHSIGSVGASFHDAPGGLLNRSSWIQTGWYTGCFPLGNPPPCRYNTTGAYGENYHARSGTYNAYEIAFLALSAHVIFKVEFDGHSCFVAYWNYSTSTGSICSTPNYPLPTSAAVWAASEAHTHISGTIVEMPLTTYGNANPNTNNGLRIKGGSGWVAWTTAPNGHLTSFYDERNGAPGCNIQNPGCTVYYYFSQLNSNYRFQAYGENTG